LGGLIDADHAFNDAIAHKEKTMPETPIELAVIMNLETWKKYDLLADQLSCSRRTEVLLAASGFLEAIKRLAINGVAPGETPVIQPLATVPQVMLLLAHLHIKTKTPLYFSDALYDAWAAVTDPVPVECSACGYRQPSGCVACVVCGRRTGEIGIWSRGGRAILN
jgi:hypothetical protein